VLSVERWAETRYMVSWLNTTIAKREALTAAKDLRTNVSGTSWICFCFKPILVTSLVAYVFAFFLTVLQHLFLNNFLLGCSGYLNFSVLFLGIPARFYLNYDRFSFPIIALTMVAVPLP
jgi:hypothetical protein